MNKLQFIGTFLMCIGQLHAQNIPDHFAVKVSYDIEITIFKQIPVTAEISQLTDFEKLSFRPIIERQHQDHYLNSSNNISTVISYGSLSTSGEQSHENKLRRLIIDGNGVFGYDANNMLLDLGPVSVKAQESDVALNTAINPQNFFVIPAFSVPSTEFIATATNNGYNISTSEHSFTISGNGEEFTYDAAQKLLERKVFQEGRPFLTTREFYTEDGNGNKVPSIKIETTYETSQAGLLIEVVTIERTTNYSRVTN